jgi:hypothetical protein
MIAANDNEKDSLRALIDDEIEACTECECLGFIKRSDCEACAHAVAERLAEQGGDA